MEAINRRRQAEQPDFTIVGADRVHPGQTGHLVMAYLFLKAQNVTPIVSELTSTDARGASCARQLRRLERLRKTAH